MAIRTAPLLHVLGVTVETDANRGLPVFALVRTSNLMSIPLVGIRDSHFKHGPDLTDDMTWFED